MNGLSAVFAGRFVEQKNLDLAVAGLRSVDGLTLYLIGDGPERARIADVIAAAGLGDRIRLIPPVSQERAGAWMRAADVTVLPSSWENFPHAAVESLAQGTPVVATAVGGVPEIVEHDSNGWLLPSGDEAALSAALTRFTRDESTRERWRAGAAATGDRFDPDVLFAKAEALIRRAAARGPRA
jgi:glycosyltransferase involved in cell wall biosynthesis